MLPTPAPQDVTLRCPFPGCRTVITLPIVWRPSTFNPDAAAATLTTATLDEHIRQDHPTTWHQDGTTSTLAPVAHNGLDLQCQRRQVAGRGVLWAAAGDARCPVCRTQTDPDPSLL